MVRGASLVLGFGVSIAVPILQPAWADRAPTPEEKARIEAALRTAGFQRWEDFEFDQNGWEVDGAMAADNQRYELKLDANTFAILKRKADQDD